MSQQQPAAEEGPEKECLMTRFRHRMNARFWEDEIMDFDSVSALRKFTNEEVDPLAAASETKVATWAEEFIQKYLITLPPGQDAATYFSLTNLG